MRTTDRRSGPGAELARAAVALGMVLGAASCTTTSGGGAAAPAVRAPIAADTTVKYKKGGGPNPDDPYLLVIAFVGGCPDSLVSDFLNCPNVNKDCVRVKGGQSVRFESTDPFVLEFDPFGGGKIESTAGGSPTQHVVLKQAGMHGHDQGKPYTFVVRAKSGCKDDKPLDPQIILD